MPTVRLHWIFQDLQAYRALQTGVLHLAQTLILKANTFSSRPLQIRPGFEVQSLFA